MTVLLLKLLLAPLLVVGSSLAGRRWGPNVAGVLVGLPIVAGPILFISYLQHGAGFAADAARSSLFGLVSLAAFAVVFARAARRLAWVATLGATWIVVLAIDAALSPVRVSTLVALAFTLVATVAAMALMPKTAPGRPTGPAGPVTPSWDLPARAAATGLLVLTVTTASSALGPRWTGILAPFPIATSVVAAFARAQAGPAVTARTLAGVLTGLFGFALFCVTLTVILRPLGGPAFAVGAVVTVAVQLLIGRARRRLRT